MSEERPKVIGLRGQATFTPGEPCEVTVKAARDLLEMAEAGECRAICAVYRYADNSVGACSAGQIGGYSMLGALEMLRADLVDANRGEDGEC